ncbi:hypothetical protein LEP1GSC059_3215 [Leptospira noguchii serovar Panama str. CZ214]|uniref:Uncharacterized protein n=2 Tax=Leptospira noguchii TaxID=28182 RepID=T0GNH1_9LEPT|nr:hypothetical protein LEP1GSC059_2342 [Leptospira noguchii serovar Panama str. CZ214]EQA70437.1 hypothetical protein LEP1GSC059_0720 [Leptospira noguchii serovar Panama str. CZ214]EQA72385.1 hypothetical protein LEP1GSC059_3685 [Leptospira noguchii serovar Panama str. CZ214]EQA72527.1 hypothetical protein LEP1GSC059_3215 [Leptospira noguchii serovar Panama str. CZ214]
MHRESIGKIGHKIKEKSNQMSARNIELNWMHRFLKFSNWMPSYFKISLHWIAVGYFIPWNYIEEIQANGLRILNLKMRKGLSEYDSSRQFLHVVITIISIDFYTNIYSREGFYIQADAHVLGVKA